MELIEDAAQPPAMSRAGVLRWVEGPLALGGAGLTLPAAISFLAGAFPLRWTNSSTNLLSNAMRTRFDVGRFFQRNFHGYSLIGLLILMALTILTGLMAVSCFRLN